MSGFCPRDVFGFFVLLATLFQKYLQHLARVTNLSKKKICPHLCHYPYCELVLVQALELAQLDSNRAYINALAQFLPSSARLESELAQLNSNSTLQLDELDRAFRAIQLVNIGAITE